MFPNLTIGYNNNKEYNVCKEFRKNSTNFENSTRGSFFKSFEIRMWNEYSEHSLQTKCINPHSAHSHTKSKTWTCIQLWSFSTGWYHRMVVFIQPMQWKQYILIIILQLFPVTTFGLGVWQIKRKIWKEQLIANLKSQMSKDPVDLPEELVATDIYYVMIWI